METVMKYFYLIPCAMIALAIAACDRQTSEPPPPAGESKMDTAKREIKEATDATIAAASEAADEAGEATRKAAEKTAEVAGKAADKAGDALKEAAQDVEHSLRRDDEPTPAPAAE